MNNLKRMIVLFALALLTSCSSNSKQLGSHQDTQQIKSTMEQSTESNEPVKVSLKISSFDMSYKDESTDDHIDETYSGDGIITLNGSEEITKHTYFVFVDVKKLSGGDTYSNGDIRTVIVNNGIGKFSTRDWNYHKDSRMTKPIYEAKIIGYVQAEDYLGEVVKSQ